MFGFNVDITIRHVAVHDGLLHNGLYQSIRNNFPLYRMPAKRSLPRSSDFCHIMWHLVEIFSKNFVMNIYLTNSALSSTKTLMSSDHYFSKKKKKTVLERFLCVKKAFFREISFLIYI